MKANMRLVYFISYEVKTYMKKDTLVRVHIRNNSTDRVKIDLTGYKTTVGTNTTDKHFISLGSCANIDSFHKQSLDLSTFFARW